MAAIVMRHPSVLSHWLSWSNKLLLSNNYSDVIISTMASQVTGVSVDYSSVCSGADQRKHQSSTSLAFVMGIHRWPVNSLHKGPVRRKMFPFDDVIMLMKTSESACDHTEQGKANVPSSISEVFPSQLFWHSRNANCASIVMFNESWGFTLYHFQGISILGQMKE